MSLNWFGNPAWNDDHPPSTDVAVICTGCKRQMNWEKPMNYSGLPPKCDCGGTVKPYTPDWRYR